MASDGSPGQIPVSNLVQGSQAAQPINTTSPSGKSLPTGGKTAASAAASTSIQSSNGAGPPASGVAAAVPTVAASVASGSSPAAQPGGGGGQSASNPSANGAPAANPKTPVQPTADPKALVESLNKFLNDSGRPDQFKLDPSSGGRMIQQINPATGAVVGEFSATEFPALARSVGVAGLLIDSRA